MSQPHTLYYPRTLKTPDHRLSSGAIDGHLNYKRESTLPGNELSLETYVIGICDSCHQISELLQLPGREDKNCFQCDSDICTMVLLYEAINDAERRGLDTERLEYEATEILLRFLDRCGLDPATAK
jgi:hypothetical protein